ncbi:hypothetical protein GCM10009827_006110 [Dactylosporangium maewongense]|uniref:Uncharacterized protein n=1 Tax=Dactylosporangium maewongense TaxID=634393 RepID=A0ABN1ZKB5_9ACTN
MRRIWRGAGTVLLVGGAAAVTTMLLATALWGQHDDRSWPSLLWAGVNGLLWDKGVVKFAVAAGLGFVIAVRAVARRVRRTDRTGRTAAERGVPARPDRQHAGSR